MSTMREPDAVVALLCADLHLSHNAPTARSAEPDWYVAQGRVLHELGELQEVHNVPILFAGDLFDSWRSPPELINFALRALPTMYCIPGQHDLPYHDRGEVVKSAYWTLVLAGKIKNLDYGLIPKGLIPKNKLIVYPFTWGWDVGPWEVGPADKGMGGGYDYSEGDLHIAVTHEFCWMPGHTYPGAPPAKELTKLGSKLKGYDVAVFGDNHSHFASRVGDCNVWNCGCLIRRKRDERKYKPTVGLLYSDGHIEPHFLDTSEDEWLDEELVEVGEDFVEMGDFLSELELLDSASRDFKEAIHRYLREHDVRDLTRKILVEGVGE